MIIATFQVIDKLGKAWFFQETFLLANISIKVILEMLFLIFNNIDVQFAKKDLIWRSYTTKKVLPITWQIELINKKVFAKATLDKNVKAFVVHVGCLSLGLKMTIYLAWEAQIASLLAKKVTVLVKYADFANVFLKELAKVLWKQTSINKHAIKLKDHKQSIYKLIYSLGLVELKIFKTYIKINLVNSFIRSLKSPPKTFIFFIWKFDNSFYLCINY